MLELPLSPTQFHERYFEREPALWRGACAQVTFSMTELDRVIEQIEPHERTLQIFNGGLVAQHLYTSDAVELGEPRRRLDKMRFYEQLRAGATLVLNRIETHSTVCRRLCAEIGRFAGLQTTSNAYLSFTGGGTFGKHWDTHDVFAIQLIGRKRWQVYAPTWPLPLSQQTSASFPPQASVLVLDTMLAPGDVLYVPRGWWHHAFPLDEASFHLSVGTYAATVHDYLMWVFSQCLPQYRVARQAFPPRESDIKALEEMFVSLRSAALSPQARREFQLELQRRERQCADLDLARHVCVQAEALPSTARVRLTSMCTAAADQPYLIINGQLMQLDDISAKIVAVLRSCASMTVDALYAHICNVGRELVDAALIQLSERDVVSLEV